MARDYYFCTNSQLSRCLHVSSHSNHQLEKHQTQFSASSISGNTFGSILPICMHANCTDLLLFSCRDHISNSNSRLLTGNGLDNASLDPELRDGHSKLPC